MTFKYTQVDKANNLWLFNEPARCYASMDAPPYNESVPADGTTYRKALCEATGDTGEADIQKKCDALYPQCVGYNFKTIGGVKTYKLRSEIVMTKDANGQPTEHPYCPVNKDTKKLDCTLGSGDSFMIWPPPNGATKTDWTKKQELTKESGLWGFNEPARCYAKMDKPPYTESVPADGTTYRANLCEATGDTGEADIQNKCDALGAECVGYNFKTIGGVKTYKLRSEIVMTKDANGQPTEHPYCPVNKDTKKLDCTLGSGQTFIKCLASITKLPKVVNGNIEQVEIKDLKVGDIVQTTRGNMPISDIMKTDTRGYVHDNYVKIEKGALGENLPLEDLYVTHEHSFSLGYYKNSMLNRNIYDNEQDDMVYLHITADQLADKLPGITRVSKEFESAINLVFDEHTSINVYGLDVMMHHPKGNPYILPEEKYQDKSKFNSKVQKPLFAQYDMLVNAKPEHMEMNKFLGNCITANLSSKLTLNNANNISFTPRKTMLTEDLRHKLMVR